VHGEELLVTALEAFMLRDANWARVLFPLVSLLLASDPVIAAGCKLGKIVEFPITMAGPRALTTAKINDVDVQFVVDSGAFYSMISAASAAQLKLKTTPAPFGFEVVGVHGTAEVSIAKVKTFVLAGVPLNDVDFLVGGTEAGQGSVGLLGENFLHIGDVEYDFAQGTVRLMKAVDCSTAMLGYWVGASTPYSVIDIASEASRNESTGSHIARERPKLSYPVGHAYVNGTEIRVGFDTGTPTSILSLAAAARAGIKPDSAGVVSGGESSGVGRESFATYIAPVASFKIGEEEIKNTRLRIGDIKLSNADMLIGADFFLSHRIYVAHSQNKVYFTYNGGPVFNLTAGRGAASPPTVAASSQEPGNAGAAPEDAADYARRGAALASRREFDQALAELMRACELAPDNPEYLYQRGMIYWQMKQSAPAMTDFDLALKLRPNDLRTLIARAQLLLQRGEKERAAADLDAADATAPKQANERYQIALAYERADRSASAIAQLTLWIESHADDARLPDALNSRCWIRALDGSDLALALKDCNAALKLADKSSALYARVADSRGLVLLRMGDYDKSIADYDASLKIEARDAWSLYGRGIDKLRKHQTSAGEADMAQAAAIWPSVAEEFKRRGIVP
jgi:tetratricopeptide (TPR) repeat protein/predicted aspartyl protease